MTKLEPVFLALEWHKNLQKWLRNSEDIRSERKGCQRATLHQGFIPWTLHYWENFTHGFVLRNRSFVHHVSLYWSYRSVGDFWWRVTSRFISLLHAECTISLWSAHCSTANAPSVCTVSMYNLQSTRNSRKFARRVRSWIRNELKHSIISHVLTTLHKGKSNQNADHSKEGKSLFFIKWISTLIYEYLFCFYGVKSVKQNRKSVKCSRSTKTIQNIATPRYFCTCIFWIVNVRQ